LALPISPSVPRIRFTIKRKLLKTFSVISAALVIASFCVIFQAHAKPTSGVQIQVVDSLGNAAHDCSLVLDPTGGPHISYRDGNNSGLKYAAWNGATWSIQVVDSGGVTGSDGTYSSLSLDSNGNPHISYCAFDETHHGYLKYAWWDGAGWNTQTVDPVGAGWFTSLALDSAGNPHISYYGYYSLQYASWDGSKWEIEIVDPGKFAYDDSMVSIGWHSSLVIDSSNNPHISYYHKTNGDLKYAVWNGSGWEAQTVDSAGDVGLDTSLALDFNGYPHISYRGDAGLKYAVWNGSGWDIQIIDTTGEPRYAVGASSSLALDSKDKPHIGYIDNYRGNFMKYAFLNGSSWEIHALSERGRGGYSTSLALDSNDKVHISHGDYNYHVLKYVFVDPEFLPPPTPVPDPVPPTRPDPFTTPASPAGIIKTIDSSGNVGKYSSLALDAEGNPHISYHDVTNNDLKYAYCNGSTWHVETVDYSTWLGLYTSIALDPNGNPCISYYDNWDSDLKYAAWNGSAWNIQLVDTAGGSFTSLAINSDGTPHISYFGGPKCDLKYASWNGLSWSIQTVDSEEWVGEFTSLALDSDGNPHISYYDITKGDLKYASWTSSGWSLQTVDSTDDVGLSTSFELDSNDNAHISYLDSSSTQLKYAVQTGGGWDIQVVDLVGTANFFQNSLNYTSLALDSNGYPHISYFDGITSNLRYALWNGSSWVTQTVDALYNVGWCSSLALDSENRAHISYYDASNGDLRYVCSPNASGFPPQPSSTPWSTLHQEKMMSFLSDIVGLDLTKYTLTTRVLPQSSYRGISQDANYIILSSDKSYLRVLFEFVNGNVRTVNLLDNTGTPQMKKPAGTPLETAKDFMSNYQAFTGDPFYGTLRSMLDGVSGGEEYTQTLGNVKFDRFISGTDGPETFGWTYTYNGINAIPKGVFLTYQNGFFKMFMDNWNLYTIGSTVVNLSEEEAKSIAVNASKQFGHELSGEVNANLFFCPAYSADKPRGQDPLTFYLAWHVEVEYVKWSDYITGVTVDIWADTKEIIHVQEAKIMIKDSPSPEPSPSPDPSSTSNPSIDSSPTAAPSSSSSSHNTSKASSLTTDPTTASVAPEFPPWMVLSLVMTATLIGGLIYRKKNMKGGET
jgi:hypothetical protein